MQATRPYDVEWRDGSLKRLILIAVVVLAGCAPAASPSVTVEATPSPTVRPSPTPVARTIVGAVFLTASASVKTADSCEGLPGYTDIREGAQIFVKDGSGNIIGTASLQTALWLDSVSSCAFSFTIYSVPESSVYVVEPSSREGRGLTFSKADIEANDWQVNMTYGD